MSERAAPRVLVLGTLLGQPVGGVRRHNAELLPRAAELLAERDGALAVMEGLDPAAFALGPRIERIPSDALAHPLLARWSTEGPAARRQVAMGASGANDRNVSHGRFDLVHTAHVPAPRRLGVPFTITVHDLRHLEGGSTAFAQRLGARAVFARSLERAARVITVSETVRQAVVSQLDIDPSRVRVVPNAADHFEPLQRRASSGVETADLLCLGHLEPRKNLDVVLRALAADPGLPALTLAGTPKGEEAERLRALAARLGVRARVRFLGAFDDRELAGLYARAACVVVPSRIEGFGIAVIEAQRARAPLAVARAGALPEIAGAETPAFSPADPAECARAIRAAMASTPALLEGAAARAARFTWDASARALVEIWCEAAVS